MRFEDFALSVPKIKNLPLPGAEAHYQLAPQQRLRELEKYRHGPGQARKAGVLALCYPGPDLMARLLLILRPTYPGVHSAQVAFPGGSMEEGDADLLDTALREAREEVGLSPSQVSPIRALTPLYIPPSNFEVSPYLGWASRPQLFVPQPSEVASLIEVPLASLLQEGSLTSRRLSTSYAREIEVPAFLLEGHVVWGATAMMLNELKLLLQAV